MALDPLTAAFEIGGKILDKIFPDPEERDKAKIKLLELQQTGELARLTADTELAKAQMEINKQEATHKSIFIAGWRPAVGWCCAGAFAYHFILQPLLVFIMVNAGRAVELPEFDMDALYTVLMGMLGFGAMRSVEKVKGAGNDRA